MTRTRMKRKRSMTRSKTRFNAGWAGMRGVDSEELVF